MYIKYCGFTRLQDVEDACACGVNAIGFVMYPPSARYVNLAMVKALTMSIPESIDRVAVTVNMPFHMLEQLIDDTRINTIQLHGDEPIAYIKHLRTIRPNVQIFKAIHGTETLQKQVTQFAPFVDRVIIDTPSEAYGGVGTPFDWRVLQNLSLDDIVIAGGLNQETLPVLLKQVPHVNGIDIASGIERERKGLKSKDKMIVIKQLIGGSL
ncbi:phosphoribosylanthranilate isomerase [Staphylococcus muscae]|uniref:N-(5'-phosphoribosyl)anthranilate isomerase n=1 Tax=Staphylococcus muscae TaxID=1294 RepID=A0A240C8N5_9STAP|nr:phosphoribosylanthranilate isomerase [Staphylococcus muscae]AVQ33810.1 phosphoribosylanthranilate isomerase [Staphylococcus muscae]PNZ06317.1 phosphoribosylanthranilate isomerase [Staphylococcus muscae]GGA87899.1 N-(5'-phosphoribosyl)anthranilate isomerase [Staphylococcus muscae]SNW04337.1 N-(5'phosphoribosyl)anthranilate isomerase [Staphylococcus muscae]